MLFYLCVTYVINGVCCAVTMWKRTYWGSRTVYVCLCTLRHIFCLARLSSFRDSSTISLVCYFSFILCASLSSVHYWATTAVVVGIVVVIEAATRLLLLILLLLLLLLLRIIIIIPGLYPLRRKPYARVHLNHLFRVGQHLAPGGRQLVGQTANLMSESAGRLIWARHSPRRMWKRDSWVVQRLQLNNIKWWIFCDSCVALCASGFSCYALTRLAGRRERRAREACKRRRHLIWIKNPTRTTWLLSLSIFLWKQLRPI